jgi:VWA domain containing CoxE-like protein
VNVLTWAIAGAGVATLLALLLRQRRPAAALPLADAPSFRRAARRSATLWLALVTVLAAVLALIVGLLAGTGSGPRPLLRSGTAAIVVVDVSSSTRSAAKSISRVLGTLTSDPRRRLGLVVFSNAAYDALPPSTPADGLKGWLDRFAREKPSTSPWASFSSGTAISTGLVLAHRLLHRDHVVKPHVVLVSDLVDTESDVPKLQAVIARYQREGIDLRIVKVERHPSRQAPNLAFLEHAASATVDAGRPSGGDSRLPLLATLVAAAALLAAGYELAFHPFTWRPAT